MVDIIRKIKILKKKKCSLIRSFYYSFICSHIQTEKGSRILIDHKSKLHFQKKSMLYVKNGSLYIGVSNIDFMIPSNIFLAKDSTWICTGGGTIYSTSISVWNGGSLITNDNFLTNAFVRICCEKKIVFGKNNMIARNCYFNDSNSHTIYKSGKEVTRQKNIIVGDNVWFCSNVIVLKGVHIGDNVILAAGSIVNHDIKDNQIFMNQIEDKYIEDTFWKR